MIRKVSVRIPLRKTIFKIFFSHQVCIFVFRKCISWIISVYFLFSFLSWLASFPQHPQCRALVFAPTVVVQKLTRTQLEEMLSVQTVGLCWRTRSLCQRFSLKNTQLGHPQSSGSLFPLMVNKKTNFNKKKTCLFHYLIYIVFISNKIFILCVSLNNVNTCNTLFMIICFNPSPPPHPW